MRVTTDITTTTTTTVDGGSNDKKKKMDNDNNSNNNNNNNNGGLILGLKFDKDRTTGDYVLLSAFNCYMNHLRRHVDRNFIDRRVLHHSVANHIRHFFDICPSNSRIKAISSDLESSQQALSITPTTLSWSNTAPTIVHHPNPHTLYPTLPSKLTFSLISFLLVVVSRQ